MILGVMGQAGSGKDVMADYLVNKYAFVKIGFADPMKRFVQEIFEFSDDQIWGPSESRNAPDTRYVVGSNQWDEMECLSPRFALQTLGTEWGRKCYPQVWVEYALRVAKNLLSNGSLRYNQKTGLYETDKDDGRETRGIVISDVRFQNEVSGIQKGGGKVIRIRRDGVHGNVGIKGHASEEEQKTIPDSMVDGVLEVPEGIVAYKAAIERFLLSQFGLRPLAL